MAVENYTCIEDATGICCNVILWDGVASWTPPAGCTAEVQKPNYNTGTGALSATNGSANITVTGALFQTDGIEVGRKLMISGDSTVYTIAAITSETGITLDQVYAGVTTAVGEYNIQQITIGDVIG